MLYERKIRYLDYLSNGERIQGGGFAKLEVKNGSLLMELNVMGLYRMDSLEREILLCADGREKLIGRITISNGRGQYRQVWHGLDDIGGTGIRYEELQGIRIPLGAGREVSGRWEQRRGAAHENVLGNAVPAREENFSGNRNRETDADAGVGKETLYQEKGGINGDKDGASDINVRMGDVGGEERREAENGRNESVKGSLGDERKSLEEGISKLPDEEATEALSGEAEGSPDKGTGGLSGERVQDGGTRELTDKKAGEVSGGDMWKTSSKGNIGTSVGEMQASSELYKRKIPGQDVRGSGQKINETVGRTNPKTLDGRPTRLLDDKWQQLCAIYPRIRPFQDQREYLSIGPADFVLFPSDSYKMVNNSFLLHGYYNYNHLLLARLEKKGEICYYIGAPGNYFEKEKQVAIMFGFESFECAEEPAQPGDFGYYMMRVQL